MNVPIKVFLQENIKRIDKIKNKLLYLHSNIGGKVISFTKKT